MLYAYPLCLQIEARFYPILLDILTRQQLARLLTARGCRVRILFDVFEWQRPFRLLLKELRKVDNHSLICLLLLLGYLVEVGLIALVSESVLFILSLYER